MEPSPDDPCPRAGRIRAIVSSSSFVVDYRAGGTRTPNPRFWRPVLYQLSYDPSRTLRCGVWPLPGFLVRRVSPAPSAELPELDSVRGVPPALHCLVVPTLAFLASHRHCDALACCHRLTTPVRGRASRRLPQRPGASEGRSLAGGEGRARPPRLRSFGAFRASRPRASAFSEECGEGGGGQGVGPASWRSGPTRRGPLAGALGRPAAPARRRGQAAGKVNTTEPSGQRRGRAAARGVGLTCPRTCPARRAAARCKCARPRARFARRVGPLRGRLHA